MRERTAREGLSQDPRISPLPSAAGSGADYESPIQVPMETMSSSLLTRTIPCDHGGTIT